MFNKFDQFVIDCFERFCHTTTRVAGLDSVLWERLCLVVFFGNYVGCMAARRHSSTPWWLWLIVTILFGTRVYRFWCAPRRLRHDNTMNINKITQYGQRTGSWVQLVIAVGFTVTATNDVRTSLYFLCVAWAADVAALYFAACADLPPSQTFGFWRAFRGSLQSVENTA